MKKAAIYFASLLILGILSPVCFAQEKAKAEEKQKSEEKAKPGVPSTPVKVQFVFTEYDGDKKVKSLPYVVYINTPHGSALQPGWTKLRIGSRVPVYVGNGQMTYLDIGTNLDNRAVRFDDGRFLLELSLERSWVEGDVLVSMESSASRQTDTAIPPFKQPVIRQFRYELDLSLRDGQTVESTMATDPLTGKVLRVEITLNVVK